MRTGRWRKITKRRSSRSSRSCRSSECFGAQEGKLPSYFSSVFIREPKVKIRRLHRLRRFLKTIRSLRFKFDRAPEAQGNRCTREQVFRFFPLFHPKNDISIISPLLPLLKLRPSSPTP